MATPFEIIADNFRKLDAAEVVEVLGWIVQPDIHSPVDWENDALIDALSPIEKAYSAAFADIADALNPTPISRAEREADEADYRYEEYRDRMMERAA